MKKNNNLYLINIHDILLIRLISSCPIFIYFHNENSCKHLYCFTIISDRLYTLSVLTVYSSCNTEAAASNTGDEPRFWPRTCPRRGFEDAKKLALQSQHLGGRNKNIYILSFIDIYVSISTFNQLIHAYLRKFRFSRLLLALFSVS